MHTNLPDNWHHRLATVFMNEIRDCAHSVGDPDEEEDRERRGPLLLQNIEPLGVPS